MSRGDGFITITIPQSQEKLFTTGIEGRSGVGRRLGDYPDG
jgi:hypothetical protein